VEIEVLYRKLKGWLASLLAKDEKRETRLAPKKGG
jgi:hypothetical protein